MLVYIVLFALSASGVLSTPQEKKNSPNTSRQKISNKQNKSDRCLPGQACQPSTKRWRSLISGPLSQEMQISYLTCDRIILGDFKAPPDGRVNFVCDTALRCCLAYKSLKWLVLSGTSPFRKEKTKRLLAKAQKKAEEALSFCQAAYVAFQDSKFVTKQLSVSLPDVNRLITLN
jgi:hypothetical protein